MFWTEGEIQGTVHRRLLEDRVDELKVGAVLLLKQVNLAAAFLHLFLSKLHQCFQTDSWCVCVCVRAPPPWAGGRVFPLP